VIQTREALKGFSYATNFYSLINKIAAATQQFIKAGKLCGGFAMTEPGQRNKWDVQSSKLMCARKYNKRK